MRGDIWKEPAGGGEAGPSGDPQRIAFDGAVAVPDGGWVAIRVAGPSSKYISGSDAFAQTSPVYVVRDGKRWTSARQPLLSTNSPPATWLSGAAP
jgi:hypothetical protein